MLQPYKKYSHTSFLLTLLSNKKLTFSREVGEKSALSEKLDTFWKKLKAMGASGKMVWDYWVPSDSNNSCPEACSDWFLLHSGLKRLDKRDTFFSPVKSLHVNSLKTNSKMTEISCRGMMYFLPQAGKKCLLDGFWKPEKDNINIPTWKKKVIGLKNLISSTTVSGNSPSKERSET